MPDDAKLFADFLGRIRKRSDKTQKQIAAELEVNTSTICRWEKGDCNISRSRINAVAQSYGMTEEEKKHFMGLPFASEERVSTPQECRVFYELMMLPQEARKRVIKAMKAYESISEE